MRVRPTLLLACAAALAAAEPVWTVGVDGEGRSCLVAAASSGEAVLAVPDDVEGEAVLSIGPRAFSGCAGLREVVVPAGVEWIDPDAFRDCPALERIVVEPGNPVYSDVEGVLFDAGGTFLLNCPEGRSGDYIVPASTLEIDAEAFLGCSRLASVALQAGVERVGASAFAGCAALAEISLPDGSAGVLSAAGVPTACRIVRYTPGGLDDPTLPARWAVRFDANGGGGTMAEQVFASGTAAALRACSFSRKGHSFAGWAKIAGGAAVYGDRQSVRDLAVAGGRTTLFATWRPNRFTVRFVANGGKGTMADEPFVWGTARKLRKNAFSRHGYRFVGWATTKNGRAVYKNAKEVKNLTAVSGGVVKLYAVWEGVVYTVVYHEDASGGRTKSQQFRFGAKKALWSNRFSKPEMTFAGWAKKPGGTIAYADGKVVANLASASGAKIHLYAVWAMTKYKVRFEPNGGAGAAVVQSFLYGRTKRLRTNGFSRKGFTFVGWSKKPGAAVKYEDRRPVSNLTKTGATIVLYAKWRRNRYKVRFDANGGTGTMADATFSWGVGQALPACAFVRTGCVFRGWAKTGSTKVAYEDRAAVVSLSNKDGAIVRLRALWAREAYSVRFDSNGGRGTMKDQPLSYGVSKKLRANAFERKGYRFLGWSKDPDATRPKWNDRASVLNLTTKGGAVVFYAVWIKANDPGAVLFLGDSITVGFRCEGRPYPDRIEALSGLRAVNRGVGGTTAADGLLTAEENILDARAATVCILFGANDAIHHDAPDSVKETLRRIVRLCRENDCRPVLGTPPHQSGTHARFNLEAGYIAQAIRELAWEEGVALADIRAAFGGDDRYLNPNDGLHLSEAGGDLLARTFLDAIRR